MPVKPFLIVEAPPDPPSAAKLARDHHLSQREKTAINTFVVSVRSSKAIGSGKPASVARFGASRRVAAHKK